MSVTPLLEATDLTVRYGDVIALDRLNLVAPPGEVLAILGPNGAGKTTFVRTIATLLRPTTGRLRVHGVDVTEDPTAVRRAIGLAGQYAAVEPTMTGRENLEMTGRLFGHGKRAAKAAATAVIDQLSLAGVADRRSATYSGGQRRRLDLGASLVGAPALLLLDEPTTGLDPTSRREVWDAVRSLAAAGTDILLTTHYLDEANELADRVIVIDHGRTVASGSLGELKASIGRDVIEVAVASVADLDTVAALLERTIGGPAHVDRAGRRVTAHVTAPATGGSAQLATVIGRLEEAAVAIDEIGLRRPTLDEVFATVTSSRSNTAAANLDVGELEPHRSNR